MGFFFRLLFLVFLFPQLSGVLLFGDSGASLRHYLLYLWAEGPFGNVLER